MNDIKTRITTMLLAQRASGTLHSIYLLASEALLIGYLFFAACFTIEMLLPTFVTARLSLTILFLVLILSSVLLSCLGRFLDLSYSFSFTKKSPLLWLGLFWGMGILLLSLIKFPLWSIPVFVLLFALSGYLFWSIFFEKE